MNTKNNSLPDPDMLYQELLAEGKIKPADYGIITSGSCATPDAQAEFDDQQKGNPPIAQ